MIAVALITMVATIVILTVVAVLAEDVADPNQQLNEETIHRTGLLASLLFNGVIAPLKEELLFRRFLLVSFFNTRPWFWGGAVISGLAFALLHTISVNVLLLLPYFVMGLGLAAALRLTGSLWVPIGLHAFKNILAVVLVSSS